jgi:hypothetical protein
MMARPRTWRPRSDGIGEVEVVVEVMMRSSVWGWRSIPAGSWRRLDTGLQR